MHAIIVSAADSQAFPLLKDLILSLHAVEAQALAAIGVIDLGLHPSETEWLSHQGVQLVAGGARAFSRPEAGFHPAQLAKLYLSEYFSEYTVFLWLDADTWVQNQACLRLYLENCVDCQRLVITPQIHRCYSSMYWTLPAQETGYRLLKKAFSTKIAEDLSRLPIVNTGAFALMADSELWGLWRQVTQHILDAEPNFLAEQVALNYLIYLDYLPSPLLLPSWCNYICQLAMPLLDVDKRIFCEPPLRPRQEIGLMHLAGEGKLKTYTIFTTEGETIRTPLLFSALHPEKRPDH